MAGARVYYSMAKDGVFFKRTGTLNKFAVPEFGLWIQCLVASILCLSGKYGDLLDMISFVVVIFYALTIFGIFILRKKRPDAERPYKAFGYPVLTCNLHYYGAYILHITYYIQTAVHLAGTDHCFDRHSNLLYIATLYSA